jgi:GntR family transcriptional regulator
MVEAEIGDRAGLGFAHGVGAGLSFEGGILKREVAIEADTVAGVFVELFVAVVVAAFDQQLELAAFLQLREGDKVRKAVRRRSTAAGPLSYITTYVPEFLVRGFGRAELASKPILELLQAGGVQPGRAVQSISARQADIKVAAELQVPVGAALLWVRRLVHDVDDRPVQLLHGLYRPDRYEYRMELSEVGGIEARIVANEILS